MRIPAQSIHSLIASHPTALMAVLMALLLAILFAVHPTVLMATARRSVRVWLLVASLMALVHPLLFSQPLSQAEAQARVQRALAEELRSSQDQNHPMRYRLHKVSPRLTTTKEIIETRDGFVAHLLSVNNQPLDSAAEAQEEARLNALLGDASLQKNRKQREAGDSAIVFKLLRMLPQAFVYQDAGPVAASQGRIEKFTFQPKPGFEPPDLESQALTAMNGELWMDLQEERLVHLSGVLGTDTNYGWGILGKLNKGGWLAIDQTNVGGGQWRISHVQLKMNLRILLKTKVFDTDEQLSDYRPVSAMDYRQAIHLLRAAR